MISSGLLLAFWHTRNNLVTTSMIWPVCSIKSPRLRSSSDEKRHPGLRDSITLFSVGGTGVFTWITAMSSEI